MRKFILFFLFVSNFSLAQSAFFDENDNEITELQFKARQLKQGELRVYNDSLKKAKILSDRSKKGSVNTNEIISSLNKSLKLEIRKETPVIIIFYPGKDLCNSSGTITPEGAFLNFKKLKKKIGRIQKSEIIHIYKNKTGIKTIGKINWHKDPQNIIENTFFNYHYPCSSYVILYKNKYISYFAEFPSDYIIRDLKTIIE